MSKLCLTNFDLFQVQNSLIDVLLYRNRVFRKTMIKAGPKTNKMLLHWHY